MTQEGSGLILDQEAIARKLRRMAYEIYERNAREKNLILVGIMERGGVVAHRLAALLGEIAPFETRILQLSINRDNPVEVALSEQADFNGQAVILVDDVANSGRTMLYALKPMLDAVPRKIQTAVLVDRMHKAFPVTIDYTGHSLSTTLKDHILVKIDGEDILGAYLA